MPTQTPNTTDVTPATAITNVPLLDSSPIYLFLMCIILLILLLYKKFRHCKSNPNSCTLLLEFGCPRDTLQIKCQTLPGSPSQYVFSATDFITSVVTTGHFRKIAVVKRPSLIIKNTYLNMKFTFNDRIPLCPLQAIRLHRIIAGQFWCILTTRYEHCLYRVELVNTNADELPQSHVDLEVIQSDGLAAVRVVPKPDMPQSMDLNA